MSERYDGMKKIIPPKPNALIPSGRHIPQAFSIHVAQMPRRSHRVHPYLMQCGVQSPESPALLTLSEADLAEPSAECYKPSSAENTLLPIIRMQEASH